MAKKLTTLGTIPKPPTRTPSLVRDLLVLDNRPEWRVYIDLLLTKRPANTIGEHLACSMLENYLTTNGIAYTLDGAHNIIVDTRDDESNVLFSAHYDSAHWSLNEDGSCSNHVHYDGAGHLRGVDACIGADDASGIYIMLRMLQAGVPALYIFHASEEVGCVGSRHIVAKTPELLKGITHAVAFDRRGTTDVIYEQGGQSCASEGCAGVIAYLLNNTDAMFDYAPSDRGVLTDTKHYRHLVPECFNISVGYNHEHTSDESQDIGHLLRLADACCALPWETLPVFRDPNESYFDDHYDWGGYAGRVTHWYSESSRRYDPLSLEVWPMCDTVGPASFKGWADFMTADFGMAMDFAYEVAELKDQWYIDTMWEADGDELDVALTQWCTHADQKYPLQGANQ